MYTSSFLSRVKRKALRRGIWHRVLDRVERGILSLTARIVEKVESVILGNELAKILRKLEDALKSSFTRAMEEFGVDRARKVSRQAVRWGYQEASGWASDLGFVMYLTMMSINKSKGFGIL